jgi:glycosyltransferase involved in cell wall biosynthesis
MPAFYQQVDIFLSNSYWEGQQSALLEAMASGCYCLSHCWGGAGEVVPPENVFVTGGELRQKLVRYAALDEVEKQRAQAGLRRIAEERFDEQRMVADIARVVEAAARAKR